MTTVIDRLHILYLENNPDDVARVESELNKAKMTYEIKVVVGKTDFETELSSDTTVDLILSAYDIPNYNGLCALQFAKKQRPTIPFILISDIIGEENAVELFQYGMNDFIYKKNLQRLVPALQQSMSEIVEIKKQKTEFLFTQKNIKIQTQFRELFKKSRDLKITLIDVVKNICQDFNWHFGQLWITNQNENTLNYLYSWSAESVDAHHMIKFSQNQTVIRGVDLLGWAWETGKLIWITDLNQYKEFTFKEEASKIGLNSALILPIVFSGQTYGILKLYSKYIQNQRPLMENIFSNLSYWIGSFIYRKNLEASLINFSRLDVVTGLLNRNEFQKVVEKSLLLKPLLLAIVIIDLDHFTEINNSYGNEIGNIVLQRIAEKLRNFSSSKMNLSRLSNDEFALSILEKDKDTLFSDLEKILALFQLPVFAYDHEIFVTASMGVSLYPDDGNDYQTLSKNAYAAIEDIKKTGGNNFALFSLETSSPTLLDHISIISEMHHALDNKEFIIYLQPIIDIQTKTISACEALIRWNHPSKGIILPFEFLPMAENSGFILHLGEWVVNEACRILKDWESKNIHIPISINISPNQFNHHGFIDLLKNTIQHYNIKTNFLEIEITEGALIQGNIITIDSLLMLNSLGINIHIDDFGTGYSSLAYLTRFHIHTIKIDKSFIDDIPTNSTNNAIVSGVISLAHELGIKIIAEGVENKQQYDFLLQKNCDKAQGYYFYRPLPQEEFENIFLNNASKDTRDQ